MQTLVFNSQKGGSGKTTLCAHLAVEAERAGHGPVYLLDTDPQGTLTTWHAKREAELPRLVDLPFDRVTEGLAELQSRGATFCFIDTAPTRDASVETLFALADLVLVPIRPSPSDLWAAGETVALLKAHQHPFLFVLNQGKTRSTITAQAVAVLSHFGAVAETLVADRVVYASAFTDGRTAPELAPRGPAAEEMAALWTHLHTALRAQPLRKEA